MEKSKKQLLEYLQTMLQFIWGICFLLFPLLFFTVTTDTYIMPKQILLITVSLVSLVLIGLHALISKKILLRKTFLDLPVFIFILVIALSAFFSVSRIDAFVAGTMYLILGLAYFAIINIAKTEETISFFTASLIGSACAMGLIHILSYFKVYVLPFAFTHVATFSPVGSSLEQAIYLAAILPIAIYLAYPIIKGKTTGKTLGFSVASLLLLADLALVIYQMIATKNTIILPFITGFQIAFAAISQDSTRIAQGFFFGSGIGTFFIDFTRFKPVSFNGYENLWYVNFFQSSSFVLDLLATTGILGLLAYLFIVIKTVIKPIKSLNNPLYISLLMLILGSFVLPYSFIEVSLFFFVLSLFVAQEGIRNSAKSFDLELFLVTLRRELFNSEHGKAQAAKTSQIMPIIFSLILLALVGTIGYYAVIYTISDITFNQSLLAASQNNGTTTYQKQIQAITTYPYRDSYYRTFSQTNIAIANSILAISSQKNQKPDQQTQTTIVNLIQQGISAAKTATNLSANNVLNWQNYASLYRSIIGFGQGSENFAIAGMQQSIILDPNSPQEYMTLGGLYFQLKQYDNAQKEFQTAISLKSNYPNAYYNLGHTYEQKGDLQNALAQYQIVAQLIVSNKPNLDQINKEISVIQDKIKAQGTTPTAKTTGITPPPATASQDLSLPVTPTPTK